MIDIQSVLSSAQTGIALTAIALILMLIALKIDIKNRKK